VNDILVHMSTTIQDEVIVKTSMTNIIYPFYWILLLNTFTIVYLLIYLFINYFYLHHILFNSEN